MIGEECLTTLDGLFLFQSLVKSLGVCKDERNCDEMREVVVVTGAGQGIGLAIANRMALGGQYAVAIIEQSELGETVAQELRSRGAEAICVQGDVSVESDVLEAAEIVSKFGTVRHIVNNAGIFPRELALDMSYSQWMQVIAVNLGGAFLVSRTFAPGIAESGGGAIVNVSSGRAIAGAARGSHYSASKGGLISLTRSLALEWAPAIRVNVVVPGVTDTEQPRGAGITDEELYARGSEIPMGRIGQPQDVADAVAFLLSDNARYITGHSLAVNGGALML